MNCIIIDDNELAIKTLKNLLLNYCPKVTILGQAQTINDAVILVNTLQPSLVFLDIEMNNETGFDLLNYFPEPNFNIVFTTAHEKYALKAIKNNCFDFLLKPIDPKDLIQAVTDFEKIQTDVTEKSDVKKTIDRSFNNAFQSIKKIACITPQGFSFINEEDVLCFKADGKYTQIITYKKEQFTSTKNVGEIEETVSSQFFRCHKSWLINLKYVTSYNKHDNTAILANDIQINVSVRKRDEFIQQFTKL